MSALNLDKLASAPLASQPFPYLVLPQFVRADAYATLSREFPRVDRPGSFPASVLEFGQHFAALLEELQGTELARAVARKLDVDLAGRPTMVTLRGVCRERDGQIHTDSRSKIVTALVYMNDSWEHAGGRLRLLRSPNLDDAVAEILPGAGTLVLFLNADNAWHGHTRYRGPRRAIQLNWVTEAGVVRREQARHRFSARLKRLNPLR